MKISLKEVNSSAEQRVDFDYTADFSSEQVMGEYPFKGPFSIKGYVALKGDAGYLKGSIEGRVFTSCARCLKPVDYVCRADAEYYITDDIESDGMDDLLYIESDEIDLDEIFFQELLLNMKSTVLCSEDCKGLCPVCGKNLNDGDCGCTRKEIDPRLSKLAELLKK